MSPILIACGGFLLAVLWMDLMFDVQVLRYRGVELPEPVVASIAAYYRRVTTDARPMSYAISAAMLIALIGLLVQVTRAGEARLVGAISLPLCAVPVFLAARRVVPNAIRLGSRSDPLPEQIRLARAICTGHLICVVCVAALLVLQVWAAM